MSIFRDSYTYQQIKVSSLSDLPTSWPSHVIYYVEEGLGSYWIFRNSVAEEVYNFSTALLDPYVKLDGSTPMTGDWNAGTFQISTGSIIVAGDSSINGINLGLGGNSIGDNTIFGNSSFQVNTGGFGTVAIGFQALEQNTTGVLNTVVGAYSMTQNTIGSVNTAFGVAALNSNTVGSSNTAIGFTSLVNATTANNNNAFGFQAAYSTTTGENNVAFGTSSLYYNTTGFGNTSLGNLSLFYNSTGNSNTAIGINALYSNSDGYYNVAIGANAGAYLSDGITGNTSSSNAIYIGKDTTSATISDANSITIGNSAVSMGSNTTTIGLFNYTSDAFLRGNHHIDNERSIIFHQDPLTGTIQQPGITDNRYWNLPDKNGTFAMTSDLTGGTVTSVAMTVPAAFSVANSPITTSGSLDITANGYSTQYIRGDGQLANFPTFLGGGSTVTYYANGGTSQGTFAGNSYYQLSETADTSSPVNFTLDSVNPTVRFITDVNSPDETTIPQGSWVFRTYLNQSTDTGSCTIQINLYKWDGTSFTLIGSGAAQNLTSASTVDLYTYSLTIPTGVTLSVTDRLAIEYTAGSFGSNTVTLYTQDVRLAQVQTTYSNGVNTLNGLTDRVQYFQTATTGTDFSISSSTNTHTFNLPTASATNRGALSPTDWSLFNGKQDTLVSGTSIKTINSSSILGSGNISLEPTISLGTTSQYWRGDKTWQTLNSATIGLGNVENTALSTWGGSSNLYILGTITSGVWHGTPIGDSYISSAATWNAKQNALTLGNLTESTSSVLTITGGTGAIIGSGLSLQVKQATTSQSGYLSNTDWNTFNGKQSTITLTTTGSSGSSTFTANTLNIPTYTLSGLGGISLTNLSASTPLSYNNTTGVFTIQQATTSQGGYLTSTDWNTFNSKGSGTVTSVSALTLGTAGTDVSSSVTTGTTTPVITLNIPTASATNRGALSATDWSTFNSKQSTLVSGTNIKTVAGVSLLGSGDIGAIGDSYISSASNWNTAYTNRITSLTTTGSSGSATLSSNTLNIPTYTLAGLGGIGLSSLSASTPLSYNNSTGAFTIQQANTSQNGYLSSTDWNTFNGKQATLTLTTTGSSGAATLVGSTLNIPQYSGGGGSSTVTITTKTSSYTPVSTDTAQMFKMNSASAITFTIPLNATQAIPIGTEYLIQQIGLGATSLVVTGGVTLNNPYLSLTLRGQYSICSLIKTGTDTWDLSGDFGTLKDNQSTLLFLSNNF